MSPVKIEDEAFVTLVTSDAYAFGAATLAASLRRTGTTRTLVCMVTKTGISSRMHSVLSILFDSLVDVDVFDSKDVANLEILGRPELGMTFTKLSCWRLTNFKKAVFLDADTLVLQPIDDLFDREEFSAAPDVGWPDCFNSGVFVFKPSNEMYERLVKYASSQGSFDGADQGLLNAFFNKWSQDNAKRLPFTYNVAFAAAHFYSYLPAFLRFKDDIKIMHFLGAMKPWSFTIDPATGYLIIPQNVSMHALAVQFVEKWWSIYNADVRTVMKQHDGECSEPQDESMRRYQWESGNPSFGQADSFMHIQRFIDVSIAEPTARPAIIQQIAAAVAAGKPMPQPATSGPAKTAAPQQQQPAPAMKQAAAPAPAPAAKQAAAPAPAPASKQPAPAAAKPAPKK